MDYKSFSADGPNVQPANLEWWKLKKEEIPDTIGKIISSLSQSQIHLDTQRMVSIRLYGNSPLYGINGLTYAKLPTNPVVRDRITYNVVQSVVDTVTAKIAKNKPRPLFLTQKGNTKLQRKAMKLNQFMDGVFFENRAHEKGTQAFREGSVAGTGIVHVYDYYGQVKWERVMSSELVVDETEALYGEPRQMHRLKTVDRQVLANFFPNARTAILEAQNAVSQNGIARPNISDQITVAESWHLPSGPEAKDGLHVICINDKVLFSEPWTKPFFPFAFFHWSKRMYGFWGQGLAEQIQNIQLEINKLLWVIQRSMHLAGTFKVLLENSSKIVKEHLNNDIGSIITYTGTQPQYVTPPIIPQEIYAHLMNLKQAAYEQAGISMLSASAKKPEGLDSGKALREYNDIETERFMVVGQAYQQFFLDLARLSVATAKDIYSRNKKLTMKIPGRKFIESIDWKDVDLDEDQYVLQMYPISSLPSDPEGRLQTIQEYMQAGMIDPRQGRRLLDFPDLDQVEGLANSAEERILSALDKMVDDAIYTPPDPYMDLQMARELAMQYYNQYANQDLEEERLDLIRQFITQIDDLVNAATPPAPPQGEPQAVPAPPPVSNLIPNVNPTLQ